MASFAYKQLRSQADDAIRAAGKAAARLVLLHAAVSLGLSLLITGLDYVLERGIAQTGGLGSMDTRAVLETIQTLLTYVQTLALPFWAMGYVFAVLRMARREPVQNTDLLTGFRWFGAVLRASFLRAAVYFVLLMVGAQVARLIFMLTPAAQDMIRISQQFMVEETLDYAALLENDAYMQAMIPAIPYMLAGMLLPVIPVYYRLRMMDYVLMDEPQRGALYALLQSIRLTRKKSWALFRLDLRFWWFYLLQLMTMVLGYGDMLLPMLGVKLSMGHDAAMYLFYALALVAEMALYIWRKNQVYVTYGLVYDQLRLQEPEQPQPRPQPENVPWNYG